VAIPFVRSPNFTPAEERTIDVIVIHTMEIGERTDAARICARWFESPASQVSAHYCVDADEVVQCVEEADIAWHARGGNTNSIGVELAGMAGQGRRDWADAYSQAVLDRSAELVADIAQRHDVPIRKLSATALREGGRGFAGHGDVSEAWKKSDHWDPGPGFPWVEFLARVRAMREPVEF
jgi:N-acetyl-anhydromuramyl-L-alanine amidase AmpD